MKNTILSKRRKKESVNFVERSFGQNFKNPPPPIKIHEWSISDFFHEPMTTTCLMDALLKVGRRQGQLSLDCFKNMSLKISYKQSLREIYQQQYPFIVIMYASPSTLFLRYIREIIV